MKPIILFLASIALLGCNTQKLEGPADSNNQAQQDEPTASNESSIEPANNPKDDLLKLIQQQAKSETCQSNADCSVLAIGHRACGGPESYIVYSTISSDQEKLESMAKKYELQRKVENKKSGMMSICKMEVAPEFSCQSNQCVAVASAQQSSM